MATGEAALRSDGRNSSEFDEEIEELYKIKAVVKYSQLHFLFKLKDVNVFGRWGMPSLYVDESRDRARFYALDEIPHSRDSVDRECQVMALATA